MAQRDALAQNVDFNFMFWLHLFLTMLSWFIPVLFWWPIVLFAYGTVLMQFVVFNRCIMNKDHGLNDDGDFTFYAFLLEQLGFTPDRPKTKIIVRKWIYVFLGSVTILWQLVLKQDHLIHFKDIFAAMGF